MRKKIESIEPCDKDQGDRELGLIRHNGMPMACGIGVPELDEVFGFKKNKFHVIGGYSSSGKTTWSIWWLVKLSMAHGFRWLYCAFESEVFELKMQIMQFLKGKKISELSNKDYNESLEWCKFHFRFFDRKRRFTYIEVCNAAMQLNKKWPIDAVIIDTFNCIKREDSNGYINAQNATDHFMRFSSECVAVIVNHHPISDRSRKKDKDGMLVAPTLVDLEFGAQFENRLDMGISVHRNKHHPEKWMLTEIHVLKVRIKESGGFVTPINQPVVFRMERSGCGFVIESRANIQNMDNNYTSNVSYRNASEIINSFENGESSQF